MTCGRVDRRTVGQRNGTTYRGECTQMRTGKTALRLHERGSSRGKEDAGDEACMSFGMNEVKFTVVHSLSKTKSLSS